MPPLHFYLKYDPPPPLGGTSNPPPGLKTFCIQTNIQNIQTNKQRPFPIIHQTRRHPATHHQGSRHFAFKTNKDKHGKNFNYPPNSEAPPTHHWGSIHFAFKTNIIHQKNIIHQTRRHPATHHQAFCIQNKHGKHFNCWPVTAYIVSYLEHLRASFPPNCWPPWLSFFAQLKNQFFPSKGDIYFIILNSNSRFVMFLCEVYLRVTMTNGNFPLFRTYLCLFVCLLKVTHLFAFSPLCVLKCLLKSAAWEEAKSHWLHLFDFSPLCVFKCVLKLPAREDA